MYEEMKNDVIEEFTNWYETDVEYRYNSSLNDVLSDFVNDSMMYYDDLESFFERNTEDCLRFWSAINIENPVIFDEFDSPVHMIATSVFEHIAYDFVYSDLEAIKTKADKEYINSHKES